MPLKIFTLQPDEDGVFDDRELNIFSKEFQVTSFFKDFYFHDNVPTMAIFIEYRPKKRVHSQKQYFKDQVKTPMKTKTESTALNSEEQKIFETLRKWRNQRAEQDGRPPMNVLHNAHLEDIVRLMPRSSNGLQKISGIGKAKSEQYGQIAIMDINSRTA